MTEKLLAHSCNRGMKIHRGKQGVCLLRVLCVLQHVGVFCDLERHNMHNKQRASNRKDNVVSVDLVKNVLQN